MFSHPCFTEQAYNTDWNLLKHRSRGISMILYRGIVYGMASFFFYKSIYAKFFQPEIC